MKSSFYWALYWVFFPIYPHRLWVGNLILSRTLHNPSNMHSVWTELTDKPTDGSKKLYLKTTQLMWLMKCRPSGRHDKVFASLLAWHQLWCSIIFCFALFLSPFIQFSKMTADRMRNNSNFSSDIRAREKLIESSQGTQSHHTRSSLIIRSVSS